MKDDNRILVEITTNDHPGIIARVTGLFARRGFLMHSILCLPADDNSGSKIYICLPGQKQLTQIIKQLNKLFDVQQVSLRPDLSFNPGQAVQVSALQAV